MMEEGEISEDSVTVEIPSIPSTPKRPLHADLEEKDEDAHKKKYPKTFKISYKRSYVGCSSIEDYRLVKKCGEGTFGQVYMAKHRKTSELVAIKRMFCHKQDEDGFPITALREIKYLKFLKHPNIISVSNVVYSNDVYGKDIDSFYVVFPYMDHDLTGLLGNPAVKFTTQQIKYYMVEILKGLSYLHSKRLLHRDIKSSNILLNNEGAVKLADFGLAQQYCEIRKEYTPGVVTQWYRSPELLFGATAYTSAVDMWGIGCIFGEFFKRSPIFNGKSEIGQLELICEMCGTPSEENWPGVSKLPNFATLNLTFNRRRVKESFLKYGESFADLMDSLLQLNPADRITAEEALNHKYFSEIPWPAKKSDLPKYHSMHEIDVKKDSQRSSPGWQHRGSQSTNEGRRRDDRNYDFYKQRHRL